MVQQNIITSILQILQSTINYVYTVNDSDVQNDAMIEYEYQKHY